MNILTIVNNNRKRITFKFLFLKISIKKNLQPLWINKIYEYKKAKTPKIISCEETLNELISTGKSLIRYGDGEFNIILGEDISYQEFNIKLQKELKELLLLHDENLMVGIPNAFADLSQHTDEAQKFWREYMIFNRRFLYKFIDFTRTYYDSFISRLYIGSLKRKDHLRLFNKVKEIWKNKDIVFIEGKFSRLGYNNDLFSNAKSIKRIICPAKNAYSVIDKIINNAQKLPANTLFILALGPTATILGYKLHQLGYRALDLGHIDIEYEWFLARATHKIPIKNKYVNESVGGDINTPLYDSKYLNEILVDLSDIKE